MPVLVPVDLSEPSHFAIEVAAWLCRVAGERRAVLLHVVDGAPELEVLARLHRAAAPMRAAGIAVSLRVVGGDPAEQICAQAVARDARWVVMGACGDGLQSRPSDVAAGRVADRVLARCSIPVAATWAGPTSAAHDVSWRLCHACATREDPVGCRTLQAFLERAVDAWRGSLLVDEDAAPQDLSFSQAAGPLILLGGSCDASVARACCVGDRTDHGSGCPPGATR